MNINAKLASFILLILTISLFSSGGCDVDFSTDGNGGNGGNGGPNTETVQGTIINIIPDQMVEGIMVQVTDEDSGAPFTDITDSSGFFRIGGNFSGSPELEFFDTMDTSLARRIINVFPGALVELRDIRIENGTVILEDDTIVTFDGDLTDNSCIGNSGTVEVDATNGDDILTVLVQVDSSTEIIIDNDIMNCDGLVIGDDVEVRGILSTGNNVEATRIEVE